MNKRKGGRPKMDPALKKVPTSISLSPENRIHLIRLGGSKFVTEKIETALKEKERAINEAAIKSGMAGQSDG